MNIAGKDKLRIGVLINSYQIPDWAFYMLSLITSTDSCDLTTLIKNESSPQRTSYRNKPFYSIYGRVENVLFKPVKNAFQPRDIRDLKAFNVIEVLPEKTKFSDRFPEEALRQVQNEKLDIIIRLGFRILRGDILKSSKYGIWSYHHGDNDVNRGSPAGVWEVLNQWDETGVTLQILSEKLDGGQILFKSLSSTSKISFNYNKNNIYWKAAAFIPRKLNELHQHGEAAFFEKVSAENQMPYFYYNQLFVRPNNFELFFKLTRLYANKMKTYIRQIFFFNQWILLYKINRAQYPSFSLYQYKKLIPPKDKFWADPFVIQRADKYFLFIEEYPYQTRKGHISVLELDAKGKMLSNTVVLEKNYHLSYPFLYEEEETLYMIPESKQNRTVELYRCEKFPNEWVLDTVLMQDVNAVDTTILKRNGKYWLFTCYKEHDGNVSHDELFLFYADDLKSQNWQAHPQNPIVSDVKRARPAGAIFEYKDNLFRPAQNCAKHYGHGMTIHKIKTLTTTEYAEEVVQSILPNWDKKLISTHTLNFAGGMTVIDGLMKRSKWF